MRETQQERNLNPRYFEVIECEDCASKSDLRLHKYSEEILCEACICVREQDHVIEIDNEYEGLDLYARNIG